MNINIKITIGVDICNPVIEALHKKEIYTAKIVSVTTDGALSITELENRFA